MVHSDIDHCLIQFESRNQGPDLKGLEAAKAVLRSNQDSTICGLSTARCLAETVRLAGLFAGTHLAFVATHAGQQLFLNEDNQPAEQFLRGLDSAKADPVWQQEAEHRFGWNLAKVNSLVFEELKAAGFRAVENPDPEETELVFRHPSRADITINLPADQPFLKMTPGPESAEIGKQLIEGIQRRAESVGIRSRVEHLTSEQDQVFSLKPEGLTKSELLSHLTRRFPQTCAVVVAGDKMEDALERHSVEGKPVFRVAAGRRESVVENLQDGRDVYWVPSGQLASGLEYQIARAKQFSK